MKLNVDVAVIGGGPAGLAAALAARKTGAERVLILEREARPGGILNQCIHNGFGLHYFGEELTGPEYAQRFIDELQASDIQFYPETFVLDLSVDRELVCVSAEHGLLRVQAAAVVLAMGCRERTRGALNIPGTRPAGVYTAGCAQRLVNMEGLMPGREIVVLGSGDIGLIMARRLTWEGCRVQMVCELLPYSSGLQRNITQCLEDNGIPLYFSTTVVRVHGRERLEGVTVASVDEARRPVKGTERYVPCDTLLLSVGLIPENELSSAAGIALSPITGGAEVDQRRMTSVPGVFACGNVLHVHDLVDNVSEEGAIAGRSAGFYAQGVLREEVAFGSVQPGQNVRYTLPQHLTCVEEPLTSLYFRVTDIVKPARVQVLCGEEIIYSKRKQICTPGEMERVDVDLRGRSGTIILQVVKA